MQPQLERGILFAGQSEIEVEAARLVCEMVPCAERVRFGSSGSEVVQAAIRLARAATGRHDDPEVRGPLSRLVRQHPVVDRARRSTPPGPRTRRSRSPAAQGQDAACRGRHSRSCLERSRTGSSARLAQGDVAGVIMEAAMCNAGAILPAPAISKACARPARRHGTILIFDEVITGFRLAPGGAQELFGVTPDLATFGKAIANGFPVAAHRRPRRPAGPVRAGGVVHGGTYNAQPRRHGRDRRDPARR